jgi:hypothetical protein
MSMRSVVAILLLLFLAAPSFPDCNNYECRQTADGAQCWLRYGPTAKRYPSATSCQEYCQCMPDPGNGMLYCSCDCNMDYCYTV